MRSNPTLFTVGIVLVLAILACTESAKAEMAITWDDINMNVSGSSSSRSNLAINVVNQSGILTGGYHTASPADMWLSARNDVVGTWIQFDLGQTYELARAQIWNWNKTTKLDQGMQNTDILISTDGLNWQTYADDLIFDKASGLETYEGFNLDFQGTAAQFVKFLVNSSHGSNKNVGLSEVQFYSTNPEPATIALLGIGSLALLRRPLQ